MTWRKRHPMAQTVKGEGHPAYVASQPVRQFRFYLVIKGAPVHAVVMLAVRGIHTWELFRTTDTETIVVVSTDYSTVIRWYTAAYPGNEIPPGALLHYTEVIS